MAAPPQFNERQRSILALVADGKSNRQIAEELCLAENTIKWYLRKIFQELGANNRVHAVRLARQRGIIAVPLRDVAATPELPATTTPFAGRHAQLHELEELILAPQPRLVTICGLGGVGKTRLAVEAARSLKDAFSDGIFFIPLEAVETAEGFWRQLLAQLRIPQISTTRERNLVREHLHARRALLILDNTESIQSIASEIGWLLSNTQHLQLLCTSRVRLNLQSEQFYPLGGICFETGTDSPAFRLFMRLARQHRPRFRPTAVEKEHIVAFCERVQGLPLALELAATWMDVLGADQLIAQLQCSLNKIEHDAADRPPRQRSLSAVMGYSWDLLGDAERLALVRLSCIRGSFTRRAALEISGSSPPVLKRLIHGSMLQITTDDRLQVHELIRQFGVEQTKQLGLDLEELRDRHMAYYLTWLAAESRDLRKTLSAAPMLRIKREWQQVETAWQRALERGCWALLESCMDLVMYFEARGIWGEGMAHFSRSRAALPEDCVRLRARLDEVMSVMAIRTYDSSGAQRLAHDALASLQELGTSNEQAGVYARITLATIRYITRGYTAYTQYLDELSASTDDYLATFSTINDHMLAGVENCARGDYDLGAENFLRLIGLSKEDAYFLPAIRCMLGLAYVGQSQLSAAREQFTLALERAREISVYPAIVSASYELGELDLAQRSDGARSRALTDLAAEIGSAQTVGRVAIHNGTFYVSMGFYEKARHLLRMGLHLLLSESNSGDMVNQTVAVGKVLLYELMRRRQIARAKQDPADRK